MYETIVRPFNSFFAIFTSGCWVAMPFMQCVTEESDEQNPLYSTWMGDWYLRQSTNIAYCIILGKYSVFFRWQFLKEPLYWTFQSLLAFFINISCIWALALPIFPNWLLEISCIWPPDWPKTKTTIWKITQHLLQQHNLFHITQLLLTLQTQCTGDKHWKSLETNPCWSV